MYDKDKDYPYPIEERVVLDFGTVSTNYCTDCGLPVCQHVACCPRATFVQQSRMQVIHIPGATSPKLCF